MKAGGDSCPSQGQPDAGAGACWSPGWHSQGQRPAGRAVPLRGSRGVAGTLPMGLSDEGKPITPAFLLPQNPNLSAQRVPRSRHSGPGGTYSLALPYSPRPKSPPGAHSASRSNGQAIAMHQLPCGKNRGDRTPDGPRRAPEGVQRPLLEATSKAWDPLPSVPADRAQSPV